MSKIVNCYLPQLNCKKTWRLNLKSVNAGILAFSLVLGTVYLVTISNLTMEGFALRELQAQSSFWSSEARSSEEKVNTLQSYYSLNTRTEELNMVAVDNIEYLSVSNTVVAKK